MRILKNIYFFVFMFFSPFITCSTKQCISLPDYSFKSSSSLGQQLLNAAKANTPILFSKLLAQAVNQYRGNPQGFFDVINERNEDDFNIMHYTALIGDVENLAAIFNAVEQFYGSNIKWIFDYLISRNKRGLSVLGLGEYNGSRRTVELILIRSMNLIGKNKEFFLKFLTTGDYEEGAKPLGDASYDSEFIIIEMMVKVAAHVFGKDSVEFSEFINAEEKTGNNALSYASNNRVKFFLLNYNAKMPKYKPGKRFKQAQKYGYQLNEAINHSNYKLFKEVLSHAKEFTGDNLFKFFAMQNGAGWNPFINAAADGKYKYIKLLLKTVDQGFAKEDKVTKSLLLSNSDFQGRTPLHLSILRRHFDVAKLLIDNIVNYAVNKPYLYSVLNVPNQLNGYTPFINAVYEDNEYNPEIYDFIKYFIIKAEKLFGRNSRMFYLFLNSREYNDWTALSYASDDEVIKLLKSYGAVDTPMKKIKGIGEFEDLVMEGEM